MSYTSVTIAEVLSLMKEISIQPVIQEELQNILTPSFFAENNSAINALINPDTSSSAWKGLENRFTQDDPDGMQLLSAYLLAACMSRANYQKAGVSDCVFIDTMKCFPRYLQDEYERTGRWAFTRGFWTWRHLCCLMFRLGTLEFEYALLKPNAQQPEGITTGDPVLYVHIPSDAILTDEDLQLSYKTAENFFNDIGVTFCAAGTPKAMLCNTWLLSPELQTLLSPSSGIKRFASDYMVYAADQEDDSIYVWLYQGKTPPQPLPLETSLQRTVYEHLKLGGKIGAAHGLKTNWKTINPHIN